jgi:hypothetical protein
MQQKQITRKHMSHEHKMTVSSPETDRRKFMIPEDTITALEGPNFSLPFRYLRTWLFSLIALIALPIGLMLIFIGAEMQESRSEWIQREATVTRATEDGIAYQVDESKGLFSFVLDDFLDVPTGAIQLHLTACDLLSRFIVPKEQGATFTLWVNPDDNSQHSCTSIDSTSGEIYFTIGAVLLLFSAWCLIRTIHAAGLRPKKA